MERTSEEQEQKCTERRCRERLRAVWGIRPELPQQGVLELGFCSPGSILLVGGSGEVCGQGEGGRVG